MANETASETAADAQTSESEGSPSDNPDSDEVDEPQDDEDQEESPWELSFGGYGDLQFAWHDHGEDNTRQGGSRDASRMTFDQARFVAELEGEMPADISFEAEVEFEHGGTGSALELEYEEFGEYEHEVEKGGEIVVEELYLEKGFGDWLDLKLGRFYVAVGLLSDYYRPTDYLGAQRPEAETRILPGVWDEMGIAAEIDFDWISAQAQLVNGLDSTGFSTQYWVSSGHQSRFELIRARDLAVVGRLDFHPTDWMTVGTSAYWGRSSGNRPKPDLAKQCQDGSSGNSDREIARCGYLSAPVVIADVHLAIDHPVVRARAAAVYGHLGNADQVSQANSSLSNNLDVLRNTVSDQALSAWGEVGLDVGRLANFNDHHSFEPYVRADYVDSVFRPRDSMNDSPLNERLNLSAGFAYTYRDALVSTVSFIHRRYGSADLNRENSVFLSQGFTY